MNYLALMLADTHGMPKALHETRVRACSNAHALHYRDI
jgi:hypothetical protein